VTVAVRGEAAEVLRAEAQAVLAMVLDENRRGTLAAVIAAVDDGELADEDDAAAAEQLLELGLVNGRIRALYGPEAEQATVGLLRRLPRGRAAAESAREVTEALSSLEGRVVDQIAVRVLSPGEFAVSISAGGLELSARLGRAGARLNTIVA
jgi:hypothetical protein